MNAKILFPFSLTTLFVFSCTTASISLGTETSDHWDGIGSLTMGHPAGEEATRILSEAAEALLSRDWDQAVALFDEGRSYDSEDLAFFHSISMDLLLSLGAHPAVREAFTDVIFTDIDSQNLKDTFLENPMILEWHQEEFVLDSVPAERSNGAVVADAVYPVVEIEIEGQIFQMLLDTGFTYSGWFLDQLDGVREQFESLGVGSRVVDAHGETSFQEFHQLPEYKLGELTVKGSKFVHSPLPDGLLENVHGILGWDLLSQLAWEWDSREREVRFYRNYQESKTGINFFWIETPLVLLIAGDPMGPIFLHMDTGSNISGFYPVALQQIRPKILASGQEETFSVSGWKKQEGVLFNGQGIFLDNQELAFENFFSPNEPIPSATFQMGVLGSDVSRLGVLRYNFPQGRISFLPYLEDS